ncbi:MAG: SpoIIE family protein phosphatase [Candidatus Eremiobacteraeota bacterium]|nr:SpoIIE family protein phosphatase [Candidatus Eremiobacteraeota bacterium]
MLGPFVRTSSDFIAIASARGELLYVNPAGLEMVGAASTPHDVLEITDLFLTDDLNYAREVIPTEFERDGRWEGNFRFRDRRTDTPVPVHLDLFSLLEEGGDVRAIAIVSRDISESRRSALRLRFLVDAGAALSQSLDYVETFERLSELLVKSLASYCVIDVLSSDESGPATVERVAAAHIDRNGRDFLGTFARFVPQVDHIVHPVARAIVDGSSSLVAEVDDAWIDRSSVSAEHAASTRSLNLRSLLTVPLVAGGDVVGALTCALAREEAYRPILKLAYDAEDLFFFEEVGRRAGAALLNARIYARERRIATSLQAASLPRSLPERAGVRIDAEYRPGSSEATIGGDWYDAFTLDDGRIAITVGDVVGHGLLAAITMTKLRQAMQAAALVDPDPDVMLRVANRTIAVHDPDSHATALAGILDIEGRTFRFACAGHPGPLVRSAGGAIEEHESGGLPLGVSADAHFKSTTIGIPPQSMFVAFTDGLVEATRDIVKGYRRLHEALLESSVLSAPSAARAIVNHVLAGDDARDDVAVLAVRLDIAIPSKRAAETSSPE